MRNPFGPLVKIELCQGLWYAGGDPLGRPIVCGSYGTIARRRPDYVPREGELLKTVHDTYFRVRMVEHDLNTGDITVYAVDVFYDRKPA